MSKIIIANWKTNPATVKKAVNLAKEIDRGTRRIKKAIIVIATPFPYLRDVGKAIRRAHLGAQNAFMKDTGAYTGEVSSPMLVSVGVKYVIIGHSERRMYAHEKNEEINEKMKRVLASNVSPVLCIGERDRTKENFYRFVKHQLLLGLHGIPKSKAKKIIITYEPVWAIGTGKPVSPDDLREMVVYIRRVLFDIFGRKAAHSIPVLYGGSVTPKNASQFLGVQGVSGLLVGGASLDPDGFIEIVKSVSRKNQ